MIVTGKLILFEFRKKHSRSGKALDVWLKILEETEFASFSHLRKTFPSVDLVHHIYTIFNINIAGNKYRLVTKINYGEARVVLIRVLWTHAEYDMKKNRENLKAGRI
ncbi:MAG: type II toxin-antitoxin system HigB family toxin [Gammaproteobacteria bacterium]|nr:type II toxin-antitoxin system HigB family toxin [Gammaproteobacteria bacterium]